MQRPPWLVVVLLVVALVSTVGWALSARRPAPAAEPTAARATNRAVTTSSRTADQGRLRGGVGCMARSSSLTAP